jgi:hypothetical protein
VPLAVLILVSEADGVAGEPVAALLRIAGQTLLERQVRQASAAGAGHIVVLVGSMPALLIAVVDRLKADGINVDIARNAQDAADRIHPEERLVVLEGGVSITNECFFALVNASTHSILTVPEMPANDRFERIDKNVRWAGMAIIDGGILRETAAMLGDWALGPTVLRQAVQRRVKRVSLDVDNAATLKPLTVQDAAIAGRSLMKNVVVPASGWFNRLLAAPILAFIDPVIVSHNSAITILNIVIYAALALMATAAYFGFFAAAFGLFAVPAIAVTLLQRLGTLGGYRTNFLTKLMTQQSLILVGLVIATLLARPFPLTISLVVWFCVQWVLLTDIRRRVSFDPLWRCDGGAIAMILCIATALGGFQIGIAFCTLCLLAEQIGCQRTMSVP